MQMALPLSGNQGLDLQVSDQGSLFYNVQYGSICGNINIY